MELLSIPELKKWIQTEKKWLFICGILLIIVGIGLIPAGLREKDMFENEEYELVSYVGKNERKSKLYDRHVYIETSYEPRLLEVDYDNPKNAYFLISVNQFGYVLYGNIVYIESLKQDNEVHKYFGVSDKCNYAIQDMVIQYYEEYTTGYLNRDNFEEHISIVYIDMVNNDSSILENYYYGVILCFMIGTICLIGYVCLIFAPKNSVKKLNPKLIKKIMDKVNGCDYLVYDNLQLLLIDKYLITTNNSIKIFEVKDIVSLNNYYYNYSNNLELTTKDAKKYIIAGTVRKHNSELNRLFEDLLNINEDISIKNRKTKNE